MTSRSAGTRENSDVLFEGSVAVAVMNGADGSNGVEKEKGEGVLPLESVVTLMKPRNVFPSAKPSGSTAGLLKNSIRYDVSGALLRVPVTVTREEGPLPKLTLVISGAFWRLLP